MTASELQMLGYGFAAGLCVALAVLINGWWRRRELHHEIGRLRSHLHTQMEISHEGADKLKTDLETLRTQNENLRITVQTWQQRPGRAEQRNLQIYDRAVRSILANTPGFAAAWEAALQRAEQDVAAADRGLIAFTKRLILPSSGVVKVVGAADVRDEANRTG
ncbi:MAG TPA: hypothetical protein VKP30_10360 [Polyangiaceae bacterium]|nr:hypothetical protein [Polyangiaceae bacterium]